MGVTRSSILALHGVTEDTIKQWVERAELLRHKAAADPDPQEPDPWTEVGGLPEG